MTVDATVIKPGMCVGVVGLGISGLAGVRFLLAKGAVVLASDRGEAGAFDQDELESLQEQGVRFEFGQHSMEFLQNADCVLVGPGVPLNSAVVKALTEREIPVIGELALVGPELHEPVIAVTGTNGKTTVTDLLNTILQECGKTTFAGGNLGTPVYEYCTAETKSDVLILEVSSFQLDLARSFAPHIGVLLNITPDHLDRHGTMEDYAAAKMKLFSGQGKGDFAIFNHDDPLCLELSKTVTGGAVKTFGHAAECDAVIHEKSVVLRDSGEKYQLANTKLATGAGCLNGAAAILAARCFGCDQQGIQLGLEKYEPLGHRMELVGELDGVKYYNDSKATNTGAVINGLNSFGPKQVLLIAGGKNKGEDYSLLRAAVTEKVKELVLLGEAAETIATSLKGCVPVTHAGTLEQAVAFAKEKSGADDVVLLSPACASFDMFNSYIHRGEVFKEIVRQLTKVTA